MERILHTFEKEYKFMKAVADLLEALSPNEFEYVVEDCYLDAGQDWLWTTIIRKGGSWDCQILTPREWHEIVACESPMDVVKVVNEIRESRFFTDK